MIDVPKNENIKQEKREITHPEEKIDTRGCSVDFLIGLDKQNKITAVEKEKDVFQRNVKIDEKDESQYKSQQIQSIDDIDELKILKNDDDNINSIPINIIVKTIYGVKQEIKMNSNQTIQDIRESIKEKDIDTDLFRLVC